MLYKEKNKAVDIYTKYCAELSKLDLNPKQKEVLKQKISFPNKDTFKAVQEKVLNYLRNEIWPAFLKSDHYTPLKKKEKGIKKKELKKSDTLTNYELLRKLYKEEESKIAKWEELFEKKELLENFQDYLFANGSHNYLEFILEAESFQYCSREERKRKFSELWNKFLKWDSPHSIGLSAHYLKIIEQAINTPSDEVLRPAAEEITCRLKRYFWPDFASSAR